MKTLMITLVILIVSSIGAAFVPSNNLGYGLFVVLRFFVGFGVGGSYTTAFVMGTYLPLIKNHFTTILFI